MEKNFWAPIPFKRYENTSGCSTDTPNQPSNSEIKNWVEINDESRGTYDKDNQIRLQC